MSIWSDIRDFFVREDKKKEEKKTPPDLTPYEEDERKLVGTLAGMDEAFRKKEAEARKSVADVLPEDPGYVYRTYEGDDEQVIRDKANAYFGALRERESDKLKRDYAADDEKKREALRKEEASAAAAQKKIGTQEREAREKNVYGALERGMIRSSVPRSVGRAIEGQADADRIRLEKALAAETARLETEIGALEEQKRQALEKLDLKYAAEIDAEIDKREAQRKEELRKIAEYNDALRQKEIKYKADRQKAIEEEARKRFREDVEREERERKYGYEGEKKTDYDKRLALAKAFYAGVPKEAALALVARNDKLRAYLGNNYNALLSALGGR